MTAFALPNLEAGGVASAPPGVGEKIIQRILRPRLSDPVKPSPMADADAELVWQTQNGSPAAFEALVRNHQRMVHSLTFRMTGSLADAEDLAQEVYARLLRADQGERATITNPEAYLYTVAVNLLRERAVLRGHLGQGVTLDEVSSKPSGTPN